MDYKLNAWRQRALVFSCSLLLFGCGGSSNSDTDGDSGTPSPTVTISGTVTYDFIPHNSNGIGLDYSAVTAKPARGLSVELLDANNQVLTTATSDSTGRYSVQVQRDTPVKVRVKAQLVKTQAPSWHFNVIDNTSEDALYAMEGSVAAATEATAVRNLHASSGWTGAGYGEPRVAAPFAMLDSVLLATERLIASENTKDFPALDIAWSSRNNAADGDPALGEIGSSYYSGDRLYILGDENNDTDEYDRSVILHEFGHYIEAKFSRSDSMGGDHALDEKLDLRVAMSEAFASAFSAMMLDEPNYIDTSGAAQEDGFTVDVSRNDQAIRGWYSEASVQSILYNFYTSSNGKTARDFTPVLHVISSENYANNPAMISIFAFYDALNSLLPDQASAFSALLLEQDIQATDSFAAGETNDGGYSGVLPVYKTLEDTGTALTVCNTNRFGNFNKLGVIQLMRFDVTSAATYRITVEETGADSGDSDPDIYLFRKGSLIGLGEEVQIDLETLEQSLSEGTYVIEVVDARVAYSDDIGDVTSCFNVSANRVN